jgi:2-phospho-L-lactate guanylyltransferase
MSKTLIVVPMKDPAGAKTRLSDQLSSRQRSALARLLFKRTLTLLRDVAQPSGHDLAVVTASAETAAMARTHGFAVIADPAGGDLCGAVDQAANWAEQNGYDRLCIIPADLAAPDAKELQRLLDSAAPVVVCPSTDRGTNALLVAPPRAIPFRYGPASALRHMAEARARGLDAVLMPLPSLSFDIDTSACLTRALRADPALSDAVGQE